MEILAENRFILTKSLFIEGRLSLSKDSYGKAAHKTTAALLLLLLVLVGGSLLLGLRAATVGMEVMILGVMIVWLVYGFPRNSAKNAYKALTKQWGEEPERLTRFYADELEVEGPGVHATIPYSQIKQIRRTKHLLLLVTEEKGGVLLKLDGFTAGSEETVRECIGAGKA